MSREYFKQELLRDNGVLQDKKLPFLKRIAFEGGIDFYVTRLYVAQKPFPTGETSGRRYRICQWNDSRIQAALSAEIGEYALLFNDNTSAVELVGNFEYQVNLFFNVRYESMNGKIFFNESQIQEALGKKEYSNITQVETSLLMLNNTKNEAIDIGEFAQLTEVIPTGKSGKALWAQGTYIIDGPAGTGKSTIALHKVKILEEAIKIEKILILVKNKSIIENFKILMKKLRINNVNIQTIEDYANSNFTFSGLELEQSRREIKSDIDDFIKFYSCYQHKSYYEGQRGQYFDEYDALNKNIEKLKKEILELQNQDIHNEWGMICKYEKIISEILAKDEEPSIKDVESLHLICRELNIDCSFAFDLAQFEKAFNSIRDTYSKKIKQLSSNAQEIKRLEDNLKKLEQKYNEIFESVLNSFLTRYIASIFKKYFIEFFIKQHSFLEFLRLKYYNLYSLWQSMLNSYVYHTVIIDEAQDVEMGIIESIRLNTENLILTGDPLQCTENDGVGSWEKLMYFNSVYQNRIYSLSHNYRQTYELAQVAYNYREILLKKPLSNIEGEYFENQKGFHCPACYMVKFDNVVFESTKIIISKLEYRKNFKQDFPIVLICKDDKQRIFLVF